MTGTRRECRRYLRKQQNFRKTPSCLRMVCSLSYCRNFRSLMSSLNLSFLNPKRSCFRKMNFLRRSRLLIPHGTASPEIRRNPARCLSRFRRTEGFQVRTVQTVPGLPVRKAESLRFRPVHQMPEAVFLPDLPARKEPPILQCSARLMWHTPFRRRKGLSRHKKPQPQSRVIKL